jgi:hypothetical protein
MSNSRFSRTQAADAGCRVTFALMVSACALVGGIAASQIRAARRRGKVGLTLPAGRS